MMDPAVVDAEDFRQNIITYALLPGATPINYPIKRSSNIIGVEGEMSIEDPSVGCAIATVAIRFEINGWTDTPPEVKTGVEWLQPQGHATFKECADWHRYPNGKLCWTRPDCWKTVCKDSSSPGWIERAAVVLARDVSFLLRCHLTASRLGIKKWPKEWDAWPHGRL